MFGLAAIAAVASMAFVGASSATAESSLLCLNDTATLTPTAVECNEPMTVHFVTTEKAKLLTPGITVECDVLVAGEVLLGLVTNGPVLIHVATTGLVYSNCTATCTVTTVKGGIISVLKEGNELAKVTGSNTFEVKVVCGEVINCQYTAENLIGHGLGPLVAGTGGKGHVTFFEKSVASLPGGIVCPSTAKLDALFQSLVPLYVRS